MSNVSVNFAHAAGKAGVDSTQTLALLELIMSAYSNRGYHNVDHIEEVLSMIAASIKEHSADDEAVSRVGSDHMAELTLAAIFSGFILPTDEFSLTKSAMALFEFSQSMDNPDFDVALACYLVLSCSTAPQVTTTSKTVLPASHIAAANLLRNARLAIMGRPWERYVEWVIGSRSELINPEDEEFDLGSFKMERVAYLSKMIELDAIFDARYLANADRYEERARVNIPHEIKLLEAGGAPETWADELFPGYPESEDPSSD